MIPLKPKYQNNAKLCYMDTNSFIIYIKNEDVYQDIADGDEKRFAMNAITHYLQEKIKK